MAADTYFTLAVQSPNDIVTVLVGLILLLAIVAAVNFGLYKRELNTRRGLEQRYAGVMSEVDDHRVNITRNAVLFEQQKALNDLMAAKLRAEVRLLDAQLDTLKNHPDREEAGKEAHELMVEKTRLEIDGLRLHNAEARRRADDWRGE